MVVKQRQETSKSVTMGHIRSHGFGDCDWHLWRGRTGPNSRSYYGALQPSDVLIELRCAQKRLSQ